MTHGILGADQARALVGHRYRCARPFRVERGRIREFARAVQAFHPAHWEEAAAARLGFDAVIAPPAFAALVWRQARREILDELISGYRVDRVVHVDQTLDIGRPLLAGDELTCDVFFESFRQFRSFDVITVTGVLSDRDGVPVQTISTALLASVGPTPPANTAQPDDPSVPGIPAAPRLHRLPRTRIEPDRLTEGAELPRARTTVTARDITDYARVVGDSLDSLPGRALPADPPGPIAPGMLMLALATGYLTSWTHDPAAITKLRAEFAHQVHYLAVPRTEVAELEFRGRVLTVDPAARTATVALDARSQGRKLFGYASAEVAFAPPFTLDSCAR
ncbi:FAS1-like dehydratase domain-containing protein [Nocardia inohanensis]|uniref:FAS1-like dehydratase domain-containing protein n=1 Tax=Nocardia inohanensis TaxID=209246 RepID=UPI0008311354|nr:MaoC family dehydratase N-terminal domain-containing protein [Nocardia inohanensis]